MVFIPDQLARELKVEPFGPGKSKGAWLLQEYLNLNGLRVVIDGDWGPATSRALAALHPDPTKVTSETMSRLAQPLIRMVQPLQPGASLAAMIVATALVHLRAHPIEIGGQNAGPFVRLYMDGNQGAAYPWCMGFATWVVRQAALAMGISVPEHLKRTYSCDVVGAAARKAKKLIKGTDAAVRPGDLFLVPSKNNPNDWIHTGIIIGVEAKTFTTIEGNTNDEGSREGFEVCQRIRSRAAVDVVQL